ncbi:hypothetical protein LTR53_011495 [Teratosphaeriaceae sp. CCFEE 6253]|nr:hypothetical protein LTR53_011495 [Teratosphaeriaceae sp. CCFEE 6253]
MCDPMKTARHAAAMYMVESMRTLRTNDEYSDPTIVCGSDRYRVHKAVVCAQSPFFKAACRKGTFKESEESEIVLRPTSAVSGHDNDGCDDPWRRQTKQGTVSAFPDDRSLSLHAKVFAAAVKYGIAGLQGLAAAYYSSVIHEEVSVIDMAETVRLVHTTTPPDVAKLRDATFIGLLRHPAVLEDEGVEGAIESVEGLGCKLAREALKERDGLKSRGYR